MFGNLPFTATAAEPVCSDQLQRLSGCFFFFFLVALGLKDFFFFKCCFLSPEIVEWFSSLPFWSHMLYLHCPGIESQRISLSCLLLSYFKYS